MELRSFWSDVIINLVHHYFLISLEVHCTVIVMEKFFDWIEGGDFKKNNEVQDKINHQYTYLEYKISFPLMYKDLIFS